MSLYIIESIDRNIHTHMSRLFWKWHVTLSLNQDIFEYDLHLKSAEMARKYLEDEKKTAENLDEYFVYISFHLYFILTSKSITISEDLITPIIDND